MTISTVNYVYHVDAVENRFLPLARSLAEGFTPPIRQMLPYLEPGVTPPFGWVFPSADLLVEPEGNVSELQTIGETLRIVLGSRTSGYNGKLLRSLREWMPTIRNHFFRHRKLCFPSDDPVTRTMPAYFQYLDFLGGAPIDQADPFQQVGIDFRFNFVYSVPIKPAPGNS